MQQKKSGGSPNYEHLSRPYLEKMKFLDAFIQPRKSYRQVGLFPSPATPLQSFDGSDNSSRSNSSMRANGPAPTGDADDALAQYYLSTLNQMPHAANLLSVKTEPHPFGKLDEGLMTLASSSSSLASQGSPMTRARDENGRGQKRRRANSAGVGGENNNHVPHDGQKPAQPTASHLNGVSDNDGDDGDDDSSVNNEANRTPLNSMSADFLYKSLYEESSLHPRRPAIDAMSAATPPAAGPFGSAADLFHPLYQQVLARQMRSSDQLLGELVTSELMKMSRDRKKSVQKRILEVLFFDDD